MSGGRSSKSFGDAFKGEGVNSGEIVESPGPDMVCPALPLHGDKPNFWKSSCKIKQQMTEHENTCYPHCKCRKEGSGKQDLTEEGKIKVEQRMKAQKEKAERLAQKIISLKGQGLESREIRDKLNISIETVYKRLREAGYTITGKISKKKIAFDWLEKNPTASGKEIAAHLGVKLPTAFTYMRDFKRSRRVEDSREEENDVSPKI